MSESRDEIFARELESLGARVWREESAERVCARVLELIGERRVLCWDGARLPHGLGEHLSALNRVPPGASRAELAEAEIGLTGADAALAETGTLVLVSCAGQPRSASLLPPIHLAVVRASDILPDLAHFMESSAQRYADCSCLNLVTGPSRTADIEMTLTRGVHGPGEVWVVIGP